MVRSIEWTSGLSKVRLLGVSFDGRRTAVAPSDDGQGSKWLSASRGEYDPDPDQMVGWRLSRRRAPIFGETTRLLGWAHSQIRPRAADSIDLRTLQRLSSASRRMTDRDVIGAL